MFAKQRASLLNLRCAFDRDAVPLYYFGARANFGDELGPFIAAAETGQTPYNVRDLPLTPKHAYCTVGSLLHSLHKNNCIVWGSGFICDPADEKPKCAPMKIRAVRGPISAEFAKGLGWGDCSVFGDPGLLLPQYLPFSSKRKTGDVVVIPHYAFAAAHDVNQPGVDILYPWQGLHHVAAKIKSAGLVVSSSLHGLILADAYRVPWIWWRQSNDTRQGGELKFLDFFQSLGIESPTSVSDGFYETDGWVEGLQDSAMLSEQSKLDAVVEGLRDTMPEFRSNGSSER